MLKAPQNEEEHKPPRIFEIERNDKGFRKENPRERYSNQRSGGRNDDQRQRQNAFISGSDDHSPVEEYVENRGSDSSSSDEEVKRKSKKSKKFKKKKTMKNRKQSASDSSRDGSEEEDTNGDLWVERTCIDKHMVGPEAPLTHLSQDDKPLESCPAAR
ncbi:NF-kappa-B-activating protein isoform X2 [Oncorhynchus tshawytscha]|uniref:NF-kappa-B-activating protein isoform X2 n=1 Tax=Oncorhynchus tshawytscha TaxID=74940 RepID=UPI001C3DAD94|nr:NF-kappa-B-activating protein isoform X2 [Oncorhynchus tshawytscha]